MFGITNLLKSVLDWIYTIVHNYGWSIVLFTILIKGVLLPLELKSRQGMRKMARIQPQINALQKKYANDKQKLQQKQSELMRKEGYNPLSGCLPMLIQMPILFAMFGAMRGIANEQIVAQVFSFLQGQEPVYEGWLWVKNIWMADSLFKTIAPDLQAIQMIPLDIWQKIAATLSPDQIATISDAIKAAVPEFSGTLSFATAEELKLLMPQIMTTLNSLPLYTQQLAAVPGWGTLNFFIAKVTVFVHHNGYLILPALAGLSQVLMTKLNPMTPSQPGAAAPNQQAASTGNFMKYFFPLFSVFITITSNAGFALYWVVTNLVASAQSLLITRYYDKQDKQKALEVPAEGSVK